MKETLLLLEFWDEKKIIMLLYHELHAKVALKIPFRRLSIFNTHQKQNTVLKFNLKTKEN